MADTFKVALEPRKTMIIYDDVIEYYKTNHIDNAWDNHAHQTQTCFCKVFQDIAFRAYIHEPEISCFDINEYEKRLIKCLVNYLKTLSDEEFLNVNRFMRKVITTKWEYMNRRHLRNESQITEERVFA